MIQTAEQQTGVTTPWGQADYVQERAPGITVYSTPRHGGIYLSRTRRELMPEALREVETFVGGNWYEEDCDAALVVLAFPGVFQASSVAGAVRMVRHMADPKNAQSYKRFTGLWDRWEGPEKEAVEAIAKEYEANNAG